MFEVFFRFFFPTFFVLCTSGILSLVVQNYKVTSWIKLFLTWVVLGYGLITLSLTALGMVGGISVTNVFLIHGGLLCLVGVLFLPKVIKKWLFIDQTREKQPLDWMVFFVLFTPVLILSFSRFFNAVYEVPIEYDSLAYHLPFVVEWIKNKSLWPIYYSAWAGPLGYYPSNFELMHLWVMLPTKSDLFVNLINIVPFLVFPPTLYKLCRNFGVKREPALLSTALFLMMPVILRQIGTPLVDLYFLWTFAAGLVFIQEYLQTKHFGDVLLASLSFGLFVGTKFLGIVYIVPVVLLFTCCIIWQQRKKWKSLLGHLFIMSLIIPLLGGFWYMRNWVDSGNPIFPTEVKLFGTVFFQGYKGITDNLVATSLAQNIPSLKPLSYFIDRLFLMIGSHLYFYLGTITLVLVVFLKKIWLLFWKQSKKEKVQQIKDCVLYGTLIFAVVLYFTGYWFSPYSYKDLIPNVRYALPCMLLLSVLGAIVMSELTVLLPFFYAAGCTVIFYNIVYLVLFPPLLVLINERFAVDFTLLGKLWPFAVMFFSLMLLGVGIVFLFKKTFREPREWITTALAVMTMSLVGLIFFQQSAPIREEMRAKLYIDWYNKNPEWLHVLDAAEWLNTFAPRSAIAYSGFNMHYPLFGRTLQRDVDYININACLECRYVQYSTSPNSIRTSPDKASWLKNLIVKKKEYVVIKNIGEQMYERQWMLSSPEMFKVVFVKGDIEIYSFTPHAS